MPGYESLDEVLTAAYQRAAVGKGVKRHATESQPFEDQSLFHIVGAVGLGFPLGQAMKKIGERAATPEDKANELLDAIVYLAAAIIVIRNKE